MAKGNLMNTARELVEESAQILAKTRNARKDADAMFDELKRMDAAIARRKEEAAAQRKREEQIRVQSTHSRAFTMLDEEEKAQMEAALREDREKATQTASKCNNFLIVSSKCFNSPQLNAFDKDNIGNI